MFMILNVFWLLIVGALMAFLYKFARESVHENDPDGENIADTEIRMKRIEREHLRSNRRMHRVKQRQH